MVDKTCCVSSCKTLSESEKFYHSFPVNFDLCMHWVQNLGDQALWQEFQYGGAFPFLHRSICSDHFLDIDYNVFGDRNSGLQNGVLPCNGVVKHEPLSPVDTPSGGIPVIEDVVVEPIINCSIKVEEDPDGFEPSKINLFQQLDILTKDEEDEEDAIRQETKISDTSTDVISIKDEIIVKNEMQASEELKHSEYPETSRKPEKVTKRSAQVRSYETEEQKIARLEKSRIRTAEKRKSMTQEEKALWREKNRIQTRERRQKEDEVAKVMRRYNNAVRASIKRSQESEEQRIERRYRDALRAAEKRRTGTSEERQARLMRDRERVMQKRMEIKTTETPEQKEARLRKGREQVYKRRRPIPKAIKETPGVLSILKSINEHLSQINQPINSNNVANFVKASHPFLNDNYVNNVVERVLNDEVSNESVELTDISCNNASFGREEHHESAYSDSVNDSIDSRTRST